MKNLLVLWVGGDGGYALRSSSLCLVRRVGVELGFRWGERRTRRYQQVDRIT